MTQTRFGPRDLRATFWVAAATTLFLLVRAGVDIPGLHAERALAGAVFLLGMFACGAGTSPDAFTGRATPGVVVLRLAGVAALTVGVLALVLATAAVTDAFVGLVLFLWAGATLRHVFTPVPPSEEATAPRTKELVS